MVEAAEARAAADSLSAALERHDFVGWEPYDALASPGVRAVARTPRLRQTAIQGLKLMPFNPRRLLGVPEKENSKALALLASGYARPQPNAVATSFAAHALMDVEELAPEGRFSSAIDAALGFARSRLLVEEK